MTTESLAFSCHACGMKLTVPVSHAGVSGPCPGCNTTITAPKIATAPVPVFTPLTSPEVPRGRGYMRDLREADQWSASLSSHRLPDSTDEEEAPPTAAAAPRTLLTSVAAVSAAPPLPESESVEELLRHVQYTVVETNKTRAFMLQIAALVIVLVPIAFYAPRYLKQWGQKAIDAVPQAVKDKLASAPRKSNASSSTQNYASVSAPPLAAPAPWKPSHFQDSRPASSSFQQGPRPVMASIGAPRLVVTQARHWGPAPQPVARVTAFPPALQPAAAPPPSPGTGYTITYSYSEPTSNFVGAPPWIGITSSSSGGSVYTASMPEIAEPVATTPEWMMLATDQWPQILLHNDGTFRNQAYAQSTTCLLIEAEDGDLWLATPAAFLSEIGGVAPPVKPADLRRHLVRWNAVSPINGSRIVEIKNGHTFTARYNADCVLMKVPASDSASSAKALPLRASPLQADEELYLVAHPTIDGTTQLVFAAKVTAATDGGSDFRVVLDKSTDATGFIGGALLDHSGHLAGIIINATSRGQCTATSATALADLINDT